jgi:hypothetical protein
MQSKSEERRMMRRFDMRLPALVHLEDAHPEGSHPDGTHPDGTHLDGTHLDGPSEFHTETQNVSARGVYFYLDRAVSTGTRLEVTLTFPPHVTLTEAVRVRFRARVIRVESPLPSLRIGTAAMIEHYEFLRSDGSPDLLGELQKEWKAAN